MTYDRQRAAAVERIDSQQAKIDDNLAVIDLDTHGGPVWVRSQEEMEDGRFEAV